MVDKKYKFRVEIDGIALMGFMSAGPVERESDDVEIYEGGANSPAVEPGMTKYSVFKLSHGVTDNEELYDWSKRVQVDGEDELKNLSVVQTNRKGEELKRWNLVGAWPKRFLAGDWDAKTSEAVVEEMDLRYQYFEKG